MATTELLTQKLMLPKTNAVQFRLYLKFSRHRPDEMKKSDSPFFLAINHKRKPNHQIWHMQSALGENNIGEFMTKAAKKAGLPGNLTNHSVRKISSLMDADVPANKWT